MAAPIIQTVILKLQADIRGMAKGFRETTKEFREHATKANRLKKGWDLSRNAGKRLALQVRSMTHGFRGFRMEMLGVMFFGMGLQRFFTGLLRPALEVAGVFKIMSSVLQILFLPIVLALLPFILKLAEWITGWSESTKLLVGKLVIFGAILGSVLFLIGMFSLGIGSVILAFGGFIAVILGVVATIIGFIPSWGKFVALFVGASLAIPAASAASEKFGSVWQKIKKTFTGLLDKMVQWKPVKDALKEMGIEGETFAEVWESVKTKIVEKIDEIAVSLGFEEGGLGKAMEKISEFSFKPLTEKLIQLKAKWDSLGNSIEAVRNFARSFVELFTRPKEQFEKGAERFPRDIDRPISYADQFMRRLGERFGTPTPLIGDFLDPGGPTLGGAIQPTGFRVRVDVTTSPGLNATATVESDSDSINRQNRR